MTAITQGAGQNPIAAYGYDDLGRRASVARGNGVSTGYRYDAASRLVALSHDLAGTAEDLTYEYGYNPASQIIQQAMSNSAYAFTEQKNGRLTYGTNGLNQTTSINSTGLTHDANGNLTHDGMRDFSYDAANRLRGTTTNGAMLSYDALGRLREMVGTAGGRYLYDGNEITGVVRVPVGTTINNRLVRGPWPDELVVAYQGADASSPYYTLQDHQSTGIAIVTTAGSVIINRYDENGVPQSTNGGRMQYTGQLWLPDFGLYHYKARAYHPGLGRFAQPDPIGYAAGANLYAYAGGDPINWTDSTGLTRAGQIVQTGETCISVTIPTLPNLPGDGPSRICTPTFSNFGSAGLTFGGNGPTAGGVGGSSGSGVVQASLDLDPPQPCYQSARNAGALDYDRRIHPGGLSTEEHISRRHISRTPGASTYTRGWRFENVRAANVFTFVYGVQTWRGRAWEFDLNSPPAPFNRFAHFNFGTTRTGAEAQSNHLVVAADCTTVITSYPR